MPKELYLYSGVFDYTAESLVSEMEANKSSDVVIRMNTNGGDPVSAYGIIAKMLERTADGKSTVIKVDGKAISTGFYMLPYATKVIALEVSSFLVHRAAFADWYEKQMTLQDKADLVKINQDLRAALEKKIDPVKFASVTGVTFDQIFDLNKRIDVTLTAQQAQAVGLVDEITTINDSKIAAEGKFLFESDLISQASKEAKTKIENTKMNLQELKAQHSDVYAQAVAEGKQQADAKALEAERNRVNAWMKFNAVDPTAVAAGVASGKEMTQAEMIDFIRKETSASQLKDLEDNSARPTETPEAKAQKENEAVVAQAEDEVYKALGLKK